MLTNNDLQQIRTIVQEEARTVVKEEINIALKPVKRKLNRVEKDLSYVIKTFDTRIAENSRDIQKIKAHVGMTQ